MAQNADKQTGEIIPARFKPPSRASVTKVEQVSGKNLPKVNLKDNADASGKILIATKAVLNTEGSPEYGARPFVIITGFLFPPSREAQPEDACVVVTGASNVYERMADALNAKAFPVQGVLRKSGRAWFLD